MKYRFLSAVLAAAMFCSISALAVSAVSVPAAQTVSEIRLARASYDETSVYNAMIALKDEYPDGMEWTNDNYYGWNGGIYSGGYGCAGFAFMLSDAAFGTLPARMTQTLDPASIRVGDILRYSSHSFIVLEVKQDSVIAAEGNINSSIMWGREITFAEMESTFEHHLTRYPEEETTTPPETTEPTTEEPSDAQFYVRLEVSGEPDKTEYLIGEELDLTGLTINTWFTEFGTWLTWLTDAYVTDFTNTEEEYIEVTGYEPYTTGEQEISVTLYVYNNVLDTWVSSTDYFYVTVLAEGTISDAGLGDVNQDGAVNASDAAELLTAAANLGSTGRSGLTAEQEVLSDVNRDGAIDASDAAWILSYAAEVGTGSELTLEEFLEMNAV